MFAVDSQLGLLDHISQGSMNVPNRPIFFPNILIRPSAVLLQIRPNTRLKAPALGMEDSSVDAGFGQKRSTMRGRKKRKTSAPDLSSDPAVWACLKEWMGTLAVGHAFYFDSRGDLTLKVGDGEKEGSYVYELVVCSRSLARWSTVFRAMLFSGFAESRPKGSDPWEVEMPEDNASAVFVVLGIVHGHFQHIPGSLSKDDLYQLLATTEKYDMTEILKPWAPGWFNPYSDTDSFTGPTEGNEIIMWISWELGHKKTFRRFAMDLLCKSKIDSEGHLLGKDGIALDTYMFLEPPGILESIARIRKSAIENMTSLLHNAIHDTLKREKCQPANSQYGYGYNSNCNMSPEQCVHLILGTLIHQVHRIGLEDVALLRTGTPNYSGSINELSSAIQGIRFHMHDQNRHASCDPFPAIKQKVKSIVEKLESPVTEAHLTYLQNQAKKTGV